MEIPDRITQAADGETIQSAVSLGDEDVICFTATRTLIYRAEGLLSDETVEAYSHDIERLNISEGRRKTTFALEYVDGVEKFKSATNRTDQILSRLLAGVLGAADVIGEEESVAGVFSFSELTLIVTDARLVKHVGAYVWDPDFEEYPYENVTGLDFEEGSVATQVVISVGGRPQRIKAPSDETGRLRQTLESSLFAYHEVDSLDALNEKIGAEPDPPSDSSDAGGFGLDENISPLVGDSEDKNSTDDADDTDAGNGSTAVAQTQPATSSTDSEATAASAEELAALREQVGTLTEAVEAQQDQLEKQSEQIETQRETIQQLIEELRRQA